MFTAIRRSLAVLAVTYSFVLAQHALATDKKAESRILQVDGHDIHVGLWGNVENSKAPWVVLLSGPNGSWHSDTAWFASLAPLLAETHRVIAIDRASLVTDNANNPLGYAHFATDIQAVFGQFNIESATVVAFASSNISLQLFLQKPDNQGAVKRALLIDPDALTDFSSARYVEDAKPFKDNLEKYVDYISAGKYTPRVKQKNAADQEKVLALINGGDKFDKQYFDTLFQARLALNNQINLFKEIAIYHRDLHTVMQTNWPKSVPITIFDTDFELEYAESAEDEKVKKSLLDWRLDAKAYYQELVKLNPNSEYIETNSRSHLYQMEHPEKIIELISSSAKQPD